MMPGWRGSTLVNRGHARISADIPYVAERLSISTMPHGMGWYLSQGYLAELPGYATIIRI